MNNVMEQTEKLIEAIHSSNEYAQYQMLQNTITKDEKVYARLNDFRKRNLQIQINSQVDAISESANLSREYADVLNRPEVKDFIAAEQRYIKMLRKINRKLDAEMHVNIDFLE